MGRWGLRLGLGLLGTLLVLLGEIERDDEEADGDHLFGFGFGREFAR
jgi:hypothetical protein